MIFYENKLYLQTRVKKQTIMKKLFYLLLTVLLAAVSCKKIDTGGSKILVQAISMDDKLSISLDATTAYLKVAVTPKEASLAKNCKVVCEPEGIIECALTEDGVAIDPKATGTATLTVSAKTNPAIKAECTVTVTEHPVTPSSVSIVKTDPHFVDGVLCLAENESFQLEAKVRDENNAVLSEFPLQWYIAEGMEVFQNLWGETGEMKAASLGGASVLLGKVRVTLKDFPGIYDECYVKILPVPTSINDFYLTANYRFNPDNELILRKGKFTQFNVVLKPEGSLQAFEVTSSDISVLSATASSKSVMLRGLKSSKDPVTVTVSSPYGPKKEFKVYVFDYDGTDIKEGDYVYCDGTQFDRRDCGLRYVGKPNIYVDADNRRTTGPKALPSHPFGYNYVGVVVSTFLPQDNDFMGCGWLEHCRDGAGATQLYEYRNFRKSSLGGFADSPSIHALVVKKDQASADFWSKKTERIASTNDKKDGLFQYQLVNTGTPTRLAFSEAEADDLTKYWKEVYEGQGWSDSPVYTYCESGVVGYLLQRFYSKHVNNTDFQVIPAILTDAFTGVPTISAGKTTGWFLPGNYEWEKTGLYLDAVNASLQKSGGTVLSGNYWSTFERDYARAYRYNVASGEIKSGLAAKDKDKASTRAFLYL